MHTKMIYFSFQVGYSVTKVSLDFLSSWLQGK